MRATTLLALALWTLAIGAMAEPNPAGADEKVAVVSNTPPAYSCRDVRVQFAAPYVIRIETSPSRQFEDRPTFTVLPLNN